ncbi:MAG: hypothetical protein CSA20_01395 [Deltaproteobacteria bacterium]|nr:MAG: hypothetical protein CSB23_00505 [Deltaproteobacteria bacterium]PIE73789.1 MAG: hypothetical protein CSA20_01395 [Deltaproteobacteria bacterium]
MADNKVQPLEEIRPIAEAEVAETNDEAKKDYERGKQLFSNGDYAEAALAFHNALVGYEEKSNQTGIANASNQLGHVCFAREDYESALKHYQRACGICEKSNDRMSILSVWYKMVEANTKLGHYEEAITLCLDCLDMHQDHRDPQGAVAILEDMAEIYTSMGQTAKAADAYRTISSIHRNFRHDKMAKQYLEKAENLEK